MLNFKIDGLWFKIYENQLPSLDQCHDCVFCDIYVGVGKEFRSIPMRLPLRYVFSDTLDKRSIKAVLSVYHGGIVVKVTPWIPNP